MLLCSALLALSPAAPAPEWFEGSLDEALAQAAERRQLVMVQLGTEWDRDCARLRESLADEAVAAELEDTLCLALDAESAAGAVFAYRQRVALYPALLFLEPDGTLRDRLQGYASPALLTAELQRIDRNEGTIKALGERLAAAPDDLELRYELALKLAAVGDQAGNEAEIAEIRRRDPQGTSRASLRIGFDAAHDGVLDALFKWQEPDWETLTNMTEEIDDLELKFRGLAMLAYANDIEGVRARNRKKLEEVQPHLTQSRALYGRAWALVPAEQVGRFGNELAWNFWEDAENLTADEQALAVEAAEAAYAELPDETSIMDTLACCYFMNGQVAPARELIARCRELDPVRSKQWDERETLFAAEP